MDIQGRKEERLQKAAEWWAKFQESEPGHEEVLQWLAWLEEDPRNAASFAHINSFAQSIALTAERTPARLAPLAGFRHERRPSFALSPRARKVRGEWHLFRAASIFIGAVILVAAGSQIVSYLAADRTTYTTPIAGARTVQLPDGSQITLGGASTIQAAFSASERRVKLSSGEAYFKVEADAVGRPFVVEAGFARVRALGTAFNVRKSARRVDVTVAGGRVKVVHSGGLLQKLLEFSGLGEAPSAVASTNEHVVVEQDARQLRVLETDAGRATAWRQGRLEFSDEPLDMVIESINRYSPVRLQAIDPELRNMTYTGTFVPGQFDGWLAALEQVFDLHIRRGRDAIQVGK